SGWSGAARIPPPTGWAGSGGLLEPLPDLLDQYVAVAGLGITPAAQTLLPVLGLLPERREVRFERRTGEQPGPGPGNALHPLFQGRALRQRERVSMTRS